MNLSKITAENQEEFDLSNKTRIGYNFTATADVIKAIQRIHGKQGIYFVKTDVKGRWDAYKETKNEY